MTKGERLAINRANAAKARAAKAAKRQMQNGHLTLDLERQDARFLYDLLDPLGDDRAAKIRRQIVTQAFS